MKNAFVLFEIKTFVKMKIQNTFHRYSQILTYLKDPQIGKWRLKSRKCSKSMIYMEMEF
jgi:hypothetical protein